jgi:hypothetical protein
LLYLL